MIIVLFYLFFNNRILYSKLKFVRDLQGVLCVDEKLIIHYNQNRTLTKKTKIVSVFVPYTS